MGASVITKWDFIHSDPTIIKTFSADEKLAIVNPVAFIPDYDFTGDIPIYLSANSRIGIFGKGELGYGAPLLINDVRFKTKPSKEVVAWLQHDEGLTITEA